MFKRVGILLCLMLTLPAFAQAWTISARVMSGQGSLSADGSVIKSNAPVAGPGYISVANTTASKQITVAPIAPSTAITSVVIDGQVATGVAGVYTVNYNGTNSHTISAYFANAAQVLVDVTQAANGMVTVQGSAGRSAGDQTVPSGSKITVVATPKTGYAADSITINGAVYSVANANAT